jgi:hypothetical protein
MGRYAPLDMQTPWPGQQTVAADGVADVVVDDRWFGPTCHGLRPDFHGMQGADIDRMPISTSLCGS